MLNITQFNKPTKHPFEMLDGYKNAYEKELTLTHILAKCIEAGDFIPIKTKGRHSDLVYDGLLSEHKTKYELTEKAKTLLYGFYGKGE